MNKVITYIFILALTSCSSNHNVSMDQYNKDNEECQKSYFGYQDCMREKGWMHDDHWLGAPQGNPYQNQIPKK